MIFLKNPGEGRRYRFHGAFSTLGAATKKEAATRGAFIRESTIRGQRRYVVMSPKTQRNPTTRRGKSAASTALPEVRMARRPRRRKSAARRKSRRASARVLSFNPPRRVSRHRRAHARRAPIRAAHRRRMRRNPPGLLSGLMQGVVDGAWVTAGDLVQNGIVRFVPDLLPATMGNAAMLNPLLKDVAGIVAGSYLAHKAIGGDRARFVVAGQSFAAIARLIRAANIPTVSTLLGEYDPIRLGTYTPGLMAASRRLALPAGQPTNVDTLRQVGVYTDGMSTSPSLF